MYFRTSTIKGRTYLFLVESYRDNGKPRQRTVASFGLLDDAINSGALERLLMSGERFVEKLAILSEVREKDITPLEPKKIGSSIVFDKICQNLGINKTISSLCDNRKFGFPVERVLFSAVLQRLVQPDSDRSGAKWLDTVQIDGINGVALHNLYRAMKWLGQPLEKNISEIREKDKDTISSSNKTAKMASSVRCTKDILEEEIFFQRRDLFSQVDLVFFDTTSIYFEGAGGKDLGRRGHSKDHRPDLNQVVVGMVLDNYGRPVCTEMWPGNTADVTTLIPVANRLKKRFGIENVCIVADRGMISKNTIEQLVKMNWSYILGARMRNEIELRVVMENDDAYEVVTDERKKAKDPAPLKVKEVKVNCNRYIVCINEEEVRKDKHDREAIIIALEEALKKGNKTLIGNKGYKKFVKSDKNSFTIDQAKIDEDSKYDGKFVLKTNLELSAAKVALKYKQLLTVETVFRTSKTTFHTRPIFHHSDEAIRGHIWCTFLAFLLKKTLMDALEKEKQKGDDPLEWKDIIRDLELLTYSKIQIKGTSFELRSEARPGAVKAFKAIGIRHPNHIRLIESNKENDTLNK
jgi:transposase